MIHSRDNLDEWLRKLEENEEAIGATYGVCNHLLSRENVCLQIILNYTFDCTNKCELHCTSRDTCTFLGISWKC